MPRYVAPGFILPGADPAMPHPKYDPRFLVFEYRFGYLLRRRQVGS